jgi:hypothetical protein
MCFLLLLCFFNFELVSNVQQKFKEALKTIWNNFLQIDKTFPTNVKDCNLSQNKQKGKQFMSQISVVCFFYQLLWVHNNTTVARYLLNRYAVAGYQEFMDDIFIQLSQSNKLGWAKPDSRFSMNFPFEIWSSSFYTILYFSLVSYSRSNHKFCLVTYTEV